MTTDDIRLAAREGYRAIEHAKRYTTMGMGPDQGKTGNILGLNAAKLFNLTVPPRRMPTRKQAPAQLQERVEGVWQLDPKIMLVSNIKVDGIPVELAKEALALAAWVARGTRGSG